MFVNIKTYEPENETSQSIPDKTTVEYFSEQVENLNPTDKKIYYYLTKFPEVFKKDDRENILSKFLRILLTITLYLSYCIVHFIEIRKLNVQLLSTGIDSIYISIMKTSLSITIFLLFISSLKDSFYFYPSLLINLSIHQAIRFLLFKQIANFYLDLKKISSFSLKPITVICIIVSVLYMIKYLYSVKNKINIGMFSECSIKLNDWYSFSIQVKFYYIQFLIFYFLTMRILNNEYKIYEFQSDFNIYFQCSVFYVIVECIRIRFLILESDYEIIFEKFDLIMKIPTLLLSTTQLIYYIYTIRNEYVLKFRDIEVLHLCGLTLLIISIISYIKNKKSMSIDISKEIIQNDEDLNKNLKRPFPLTYIQKYKIDNSELDGEFLGASLKIKNNIIEINYSFRTSDPYEDNSQYLIYFKICEDNDRNIIFRNITFIQISINNKKLCYNNYYFLIYPNIEPQNLSEENQQSSEESKFLNENVIQSGMITDKRRLFIQETLKIKVDYINYAKKYI